MFIKNQIVLVKILPYHKKDKKFRKTGRIVRTRDNDSYIVKVENIKELYVIYI